MQTVIAFVVALCILIFVHEMGHYLAARACGVKVLRFSIGFGRPLVRWVGKGRDRRSGRWRQFRWAATSRCWMSASVTRRPIRRSIRAELPRAFNRQPVGKRFVVVAAGPLANFALAVVLYVVLFAGGMREPCRWWPRRPPGRWRRRPACGTAIACCR
jgi:regulator of sigma E protease